MESRYLNSLNKKNGYYELYINDSDEIINFFRPDKGNVKNLMINLKHRDEPNIMNSKYLGTWDATDTHILEKSLVYRGHGDYNWDLEPTYYRQPKNISFVFDEKTIEYQKESNILIQFQESCDLAGVQLPSDNDKLRKNQKLKIDHFFGKFNNCSGDWFSDDFFELAVFAQHYGVPTRLLDWTKNPFVASYFACSYALSSGYHEDKKISIWVLNSAELTGELKDVLEVLEPPKGINQHISHQQGVLTYTIAREEILQKFGFRPKLQDILEHYNSSHRLLKINIDFKEVIRLFDFCNYHNFNACHLFRGAYGAAQHTKDIMNLNKFSFI
ncbi:MULTISPECIES: FRG domain-containing protein [Bacteria]|uniref:FRG domain-containing protein n=1 Tax=Bacteria TaxID=2 RepID=UPI00124E3CE1|nr:FRG domain-containing protein [Acinetobacter calcoaceticus]